MLYSIFYTFLTVSHELVLLTTTMVYSSEFQINIDYEMSIFVLTLVFVFLFILI
jgi:hypothetical protein